MSPAREPLASRSALVLTVSDRTYEGTREDASGALLEERLAALGFEVERRTVPDDIPRIAAGPGGRGVPPPPGDQHRRDRPHAA